MTATWYFRMILNMDRCRTRTAWSVLCGVAATGAKHLHESWADSIASDASEVGEIGYQIDSARRFPGR